MTTYIILAVISLALMLGGAFCTITKAGENAGICNYGKNEEDGEQ